MKLQSKHTFPFFLGCDPDNEERQASCGAGGGAGNGTPGTIIQFKANEFTQKIKNGHENRMRFQLPFAIFHFNKWIEILLLNIFFFSILKIESKVFPKCFSLRNKQS